VCGRAKPIVETTSKFEKLDLKPNQFYRREERRSTVEGGRRWHNIIKGMAGVIGLVGKKKKKKKKKKKEERKEKRRSGVRGHKEEGAHRSCFLSRRKPRAG
jgi:hypothetical protein